MSCGGELVLLRIRAGNLVLFGSRSPELTAGFPAAHELPEGLSLVAQALARTRAFCRLQILYAASSSMLWGPWRIRVSVLHK
jgi:hypothetical protein